jgi:hypothetical protein
MSNIGNNVRFSQLQPEDVEFYERIHSRLTASCALPFEIPVDAFFTTTIAAMKWFWSWYPDATQEKLLFIPWQVISSVKPTSQGNIDLLLPEGIEAVTDWRAAEQAYSTDISNYLRVSLLQTYSSMGAATELGQNFRSTGGTVYPKVSNAVIAMYEAQQYKETFSRGYRASFNKNTRIFRLMTDVQSGFVLNCYVRLQPQELYGDIMFEEYVLARIEEQLGRIVTSFDFKLPGDVQINYDQIASDGKDRRQAIEDEIKEMNNNDFMLEK